MKFKIATNIIGKKNKIINKEFSSAELSSNIKEEIFDILKRSGITEEEALDCAEWCGNEAIPNSDDDSYNTDDLDVYVYN